MRYREITEKVQKRNREDKETHRKDIEKVQGREREVTWRVRDDIVGRYKEEKVASHTY